MAIDAGKAQELLATGRSLLTGDGVTQDTQQARVVLEQAARAGSGPATALMAVLTAAGVGRPRNWPEALDFLETAARLGERRAQEQLALLAGDDSLDASAPQDTATWTRARKAIDLKPWFEAAPAGVFARAPRAAVLPGFLSPKVCRWLIRRGEEAPRPALIYDPSTGVMRPDPMRSNTYTRLGIAQSDLVVLLVQNKIAASTGFPFSRMEGPNLLRYDVGQEFGPHFDFLDQHVEKTQAEIAFLGQRVATFLVYLNDDFTGGETDFPDVGLRYRGRQGGGLMFYNLRPDGERDLDSRHAGLPVTKGRKWLLSQWIRDKPQLIA